MARDRRLQDASRPGLINSDPEQISHTGSLGDNGERGPMRVERCVGTRGAYVGRPSP